MNDDIFDNRGFSVWRSAKAVGTTFVILIALIPAFDVGGRAGGWAFGFVLVAAGFWWRWRRRADLLARMPTTAIGSLGGGYVEVTGRVERAAARKLRDPVQDSSCCWFGVETLRWETGRIGTWLPIKRAASSRHFVLRDATGTCLVDLRGAQVALDSPVDIRVNDRFKHRIWRIEEGDTITVVGEASRLNGRWCIGRPAARTFLATHGAPEHAERSLRDEARGQRSPLIVIAIIAAVVLALAALLSSCARPKVAEDAAAVRRREAANIDGLTATYDAQVADTGRAERWREEQQRWAEQKLAIGAESAADVEHSEAPAPQLARANDRYQDLILTIAELRRRGAIGVDGEAPMWLNVTSIGPSIDLRNSSDERLVVKSWRVFSHGSGTRLCEMIAHDARSSSIENPDLAPGQKLNYRNDTRRPCYEGTDENLLAFEILRGNELVWVSRSRLPDLLGVQASEVDALLDRAASAR